ncbi:MAG: toxin-antitoxin system YwqK family antitoxin [Bacteroidota bacterium]
MKKLFITTSIFFGAIALFSISAYSQNDTTKTPDPQNKDIVYFEIKDAQGKIQEIGKYLKGKKDGVWRTYNSSEGLLALEEFKEGVLNGIKIQFDESGYLSIDATFKNGKLNGRRTEYRYGSVKRHIENYADGVLNGNKKAFYESGTLQEDGGYKDGKRDGLVKWFTQQEKPSIEYTYKMGIIDGPAKTYFASGKILTEGNYKNDNESGEWKEYDETGDLVKTIVYDNGKKIKETIVKK